VKTIDNRGLEPPQPMMRTLKTLEKMGKGEKLTIINDRRPMFLYEELDDLDYLHETEAQDDGSYKIIIIKTGDQR